MDDQQSTAEALAIGAQNAEQTLDRRRLARARRAAVLAEHPAKLKIDSSVAGIGSVTSFGIAAGPMFTASRETAGFLLAAGDSWFDYPFHDVLKALEDDHGYNVESAAHAGDPIESMAYFGGQLDKFSRCLDKVRAQGGTPKAVLISGGGDDIAGREFGMLLNSALSPISGWNAGIVDGLLNPRLTTAYKTLIASINGICQSELGHVVPILVHGYDYPVPDGRGFWGGFLLPGPWLKPGFDEKHYQGLAVRISMMKIIMDQFNSMLASLTKDAAFANVHYLDLRGTLSTEHASNEYQQWWDNELHPTEEGFSAVAAKFATVLDSL